MNTNRTEVRTTVVPSGPVISAFLPVWPRRQVWTAATLALLLFSPPLMATRLVTYRFRGEVRLGAWTADGVIDLNRAYGEMLNQQGVPRAKERAAALVPPQMVDFLQGEEDSIAAAKQAIAWVNSRRGQPNSAAAGNVVARKVLNEAGIWFEHHEVRLAAPIPRPPHLFAVALNYRSHSDEIKIELPPFPNVFTKEGAVIGPGEAIEIPRAVKETDYEGELAVVIGKRARNVRRESAYDYVAGYMTFNDMTARDFQFRVSQYTLGKSPDTFSVMGPLLVLKDEVPNPHQLRLTTKFGTEVVQDSNTSYMIFTIPDLIAEISQVMTLPPGTVISTGTPAGVGAARKPPRYLKPGETVTVEVERLGILENKLVAAGAN